MTCNSTNQIGINRNAYLFLSIILMPNSFINNIISLCFGNCAHDYVANSNFETIYHHAILLFIKVTKKHITNKGYMNQEILKTFGRL